MDDYISREAVLEIIKRTSGDYAAAFAEVTRISAADVRPVVRAKWEWWSADNYKCSACGNITSVDECMEKPTYLFCPNCGNPMDLEGDG